LSIRNTGLRALVTLKCESRRTRTTNASRIIINNTIDFMVVRVWRTKCSTFIHRYFMNSSMPTIESAINSKDAWTYRCKSKLLVFKIIKSFHDQSSLFRTQECIYLMLWPGKQFSVQRYGFFGRYFGTKKNRWIRYHFRYRKNENLMIKIAIKLLSTSKFSLLLSTILFENVFKLLINYKLSTNY